MRKLIPILLSSLLVGCASQPKAFLEFKCHEAADLKVRMISERYCTVAYNCYRGVNVREWEGVGLMICEYNYDRG